jgi:hypothetical protein
MYRVGQNHIYTVYIRYFWQGYHQIYGHIRCIYTVLANPKYVGLARTIRRYIQGVCARYLLRRLDQKYGHIRRLYTVLPTLEMRHSKLHTESADPGMAHANCGPCFD